MDTPEFEERKKAFLEEYEQLVKKHNMDVGSMPQFFAIGGGAFGVTIIKEIVDLSNVPKASPYQNEPS